MASLAAAHVTFRRLAWVGSKRSTKGVESGMQSWGITLMCLVSLLACGADKQVRTRAVSTDGKTARWEA